MGNRRRAMKRPTHLPDAQRHRGGVPDWVADYSQTSCVSQRTSSTPKSAEDMVLPKRGGKAPPVYEEEGEEDYDEDEQGSADDDYVELDLERTLTWTGNAVIIQAGGEFRMPLIVPHPSVLAIQFEVDNGNDIEFSLMFKDDNEAEANMLVEPVRVTDREGQLDIDTTGVCEIIWSNAYAWLSSKTLSYQLQLAPKIDLLKKK